MSRNQTDFVILCTPLTTSHAPLERRYSTSPAINTIHRVLHRVLMILHVQTQGAILLTGPFSVQTLELVERPTLGQVLARAYPTNMVPTTSVHEEVSA